MCLEAETELGKSVTCPLYIVYTVYSSVVADPTCPDTFFSIPCDCITPCISIQCVQIFPMETCHLPSFKMIRQCSCLQHQGHTKVSCNYRKTLSRAGSSLHRPRKAESSSKMHFSSIYCKCAPKNSSRKAFTVNKYYMFLVSCNLFKSCSALRSQGRRQQKEKNRKSFFPKEICF